MKRMKTSPAAPLGSRNACKSLYSYTLDKRAVTVRTVDNLPPAGNNQQQYRPQESPANRRITNGAGDAVGTLRGAKIVSFGIS
jgi:hypothetical protein